MPRTLDPIASAPSTISIPATSGPPNSAEIAENEPAVPSTVVAPLSSRAIRAIATPTTEPSAITGASGPSTAPKASVPIAASAIPGACETGVAPPPRPASGRWPPSPGRKRRARMTINAPATGSPTTW